MLPLLTPSSPDRTQKVLDAIQDAEELLQTLPEDLRTDGDIPEEETKPKAASKPKAAAKPKPKPKSRDEKAPLRTELVADVAASEAEVLVAKRRLGKALRTGNNEETVEAIEVLKKLKVDETMIRSLQLGKIATHLSAHPVKEVAGAGKQLLDHLVSLLVVTGMAQTAPKRLKTE